MGLRLDPKEEFMSDKDVRKGFSSQYYMDDPKQRSGIAT